MAIILNDNLKINAGKPTDSKYLNASNAAYSATTEVLSTITLAERHQGLTVLVESGSSNIEYWFKEGITNGDLIEKKFASEQLVGDFITGATNLGYFSGTTGVQTINVTSGGGSSYNGDYDSIYNYYYRDSSGVIRIGNSAYGEPFRRAYYNSVDDKSWVWDVQTSGWRFIVGDVRDLVGETSTLGYDYGPTYYTVDEWSAGFYSSGSSASLNVTGDLTTGDTITIGNPVYRDKSNQELHLRSIINDTPSVMNIDVDDYYIRFSGATSILDAENVGAGSEVFSQKTGTTLQFRTLVGSGETVVSTVGDEIIIYASVSGSTPITGGTNLGFSGATSVFAGVDNKDLEFRRITGSGNTTISLSGDTIIVESSGGGVNGSVFITDMTPQSGGNVGAKVFSSDGVVLDECVTDTQLVEVSVLALPGNTNYKPVVTINGVEVSLTANSDKPLFNGTINIDLSGATGLTVIHEDGAEHSVVIIQDTPPQVLAANFTGGYPGTQTELKENDTFDFYVESDVPIINVELDNFEAYKSGTYAVASGTGHTVTGVIADRGTTAQNQRARVRVQKSTGGWSAWYTTTIGVDGVGHVVLNNQYPVINFTTITYPASQSALKDSENAIVNHTVTNFDTITYNSPNSELSISNTSTYEAAKTAQRIAGGYNISTNNFRITANRTANDATTIDNTVVWIAHDDQVITVNSPTRLRSGGNDGTSAQNHTITIVSTQRLASAPTLAAPVGTWQGGGFSWTATATSFTRALQITDNMTKGAQNWGALNTVNLAGKVVTTITTGTNYVLGGFVERDIPLAAFANEAQMNVAALDYTKVVLSWSFEPSVVNRQPIDTSPPVTDGWCLLSPIGTSPVTIRILDSKTSASSQESTITIEELI
jgi:hypothetical protein